MDFSGNELKRLGKKIRDAEVSDKDLLLLEDYRASFDPLLVNTSLLLDEILAKTGVPYLLSGRSKRTKSIIRKLRRPENRGMDLSRVSDLVGLRVLLETAEQQQMVFQLISTGIPTKVVYDYRDEASKTGYRCIHIIVRSGKQLLEIQLRTLPQHLWAVESESFGEKVKEGSGAIEPREYLRALALACVLLEKGGAPSEEGYPAPLMSERKPLTGKFPRQLKLFRDAAKCHMPGKVMNSYLIVFDRQRGELLHDFSFDGSARDQAIKEYSKFCRMVDEAKMDVLIINSPSRAGIEVTHPQFF